MVELNQGVRTKLHLKSSFHTARFASLISFLVAVSVNGMKGLLIGQDVFKKISDTRNQMHVPKYSLVPDAT